MTSGEAWEFEAGARWGGTRGGRSSVETTTDWDDDKSSNGFVKEDDSAFEVGKSISDFELGFEER
jgi:hypothetical protein